MPSVKPSCPPTNALARVDTELCIACGQCVEVCPTGAINLQEAATIDESRCVGCGSCVQECPTEAISLAERPVDQGGMR